MALGLKALLLLALVAYLGALWSWLRRSPDSPTDHATAAPDPSKAQTLGV
jgi:hypothetical protein